MPKTDNQPVTNYKDKLLERAKTRYPDRTFAGENGEIDENEVNRSLSDILDEFDAKQRENSENNRQLRDLFAKDPKSAEFMNRWVTKGDPLVALLDIYGDDLKEALDNPENRERFVESHNAWLQRKADDEAASSQREENISKSFETLENVGNKHGLSDEQKVEVFKRLHAIGCNAIEGVYAEEDYEMAINAMNYAKDVDSARKEGEVTGRNARIQEKMRERKQAQALPPTLNGHGARSNESQPKQKSSVDRFKEMYGLG